jgi:hypothetical protein
MNANRIERKIAMKLRTLAAAALMGTLFVAPAFGQMAVPPPPPPHGYGDYDQHHVWREESWWYEHHPNWVQQHHPDWTDNGAWDEHRHHWHSREWWIKNHPDWVHAHHPHWYS